MISFSKFISLKEALSLDDPLAQSTLKTITKAIDVIVFGFNFDNDEYQISVYKTNQAISFRVENKYQIPYFLNLMEINLKVNGSYSLTNKMGMQANIIYNMLLNAIKQAHDHFGENNIQGYKFVGAQSNQEIMYDRLMKRFAPNLITWSIDDGIYLKPEIIQKIKDQNPDKINQINDHIHQETSQREMQIQQDKQNKAQQRLLRRQT
jgi:hypothetical protein